MHSLIIGDMGKGTNDQYKVAKLMKKLYKKYKITFILGLGDNIYPNGCTSVNDKLFINNFESPYSILPNHRWYMCLGNHDYGYIQDNSDNQVNYTNYSKKWYMPSKYYSFEKGPVEFFYLDTNLENMDDSMIDAQLKYMKHKLDTSTKKFKVVVGHHTWRSIAGHGNANPQFEIFLDDLFKDTKPTMYICGHDHCKSLIIKDGICLCVLGTGGESYEYDPDIYKRLTNNMYDCRLDFFSPSLGVGVLQIEKNNLTLNFFDDKGLCEYTHKC